MRNSLAAHPPWRQLAIVSIVLPAVIVLAVLAFAWPSARIAPRQLPVGIVGSNPASEQVVSGLADAEPGGLRFTLYADDAAARSAIEHRAVYGAYELASGRITVLTASAAGPIVARALTTAGDLLATHARPQLRVRSVDVVPISADDPQGAVLSSSILPLTICSTLIATAIALLIGFRPAWREILALGVVSAVAGLGVYLVAQGFLGALPHDHIATWASASLILLALASTAAGLIALLGTTGLGLSAALMVFIGNPFSGVTSAPHLLPDAVDRIGQWLPPGAGATLLRSTAYFDGHGSTGPITVLTLWVLGGFTAIVVGHRRAARAANGDAAGSAQRHVSVEPQDLVDQHPDHRVPVGAHEA
jgi:hypothetical protein